MDLSYLHSIKGTRLLFKVITAIILVQIARHLPISQVQHTFLLISRWCETHTRLTHTHAHTCTKQFKMSSRVQVATQPSHGRISQTCLIKTRKSMQYHNISAHNTGEILILSKSPLMKSPCTRPTDVVIPEFESLVSLLERDLEFCPG